MKLSKELVRRWCDPECEFCRGSGLAGSKFFNEEYAVICSCVNIPKTARLSTYLVDLREDNYDSKNG